MIKRIHLIQNIGKFADCHASGCELSKENIIFGYNTQGKSTLTAILRSIQTGNNDLLIGRKTFGATGHKKVEIDFEEGSGVQKYIFENMTWNKINSKIVIFDSKFISENIFEGESISFDQQKNMNSIIIGKFGNTLKEEIKILQSECDAYQNQKRANSLDFSRHFSKTDLAKFCALEEDKNIDIKIQEKEKEIKFEKEKEKIKTLIRSQIQSLNSIDFTIKNILQKTLDVKQQEIDEHIKQHFSSQDNAQNFLDEGSKLMKDKSVGESQRICVFCGQKLELEAETLVEIYSSFFKGGYKQLQNEMSSTIDRFKHFNIEAIVTKIFADLDIKGLSIDLSEKKINKIAVLKNNFENELDKKRDLNYSLDFKDFDLLEIYISQLVLKLEKIEEEKLNLVTQKKVSEMEEEKGEFEILKKRFSPIWVTFCKDILDIKVKSKAARKKRDEKRNELEQYSISIFQKHKKTINEFCAEMGADFELEDFKPLKKIIGQDERIFAIKFFGSHKVNISNLEDKTPNFKNTLSESDKRLLAFAFFLSLLVNDKNLHEKIVIFDDPMSSFDSERRRKSIHLMADIGYRYKDSTGSENVNSPNQKIIFTHEDRFAKELFRILDNACTLRIEEYKELGNKRSRIIHSDFSKDFPDDDILDKIQKLRIILDDRNFTNAFEIHCRIVLENIFKRKYYFDLKELITSRKSVRSFVTKLKDLNINDYDSDSKFNKFIRVCDDLNIELHDNGASSSNGNKESILKDFFEIIKII